MSSKPGNLRPIPSENPLQRGVKTAVAAVLAGACILYLLNPGGGIIEILPDNLPIFGNLDEAAVVALLLSCMAFLGIDLRPFKKFFPSRHQPDRTDSPTGKREE